MAMDRATGGVESDDDTVMLTCDNTPERFPGSS